MQDAPKTSTETAFTVEASDSGQTVSGHGVAFEVPADWEPSGDESRSTDERTYEWAIQAPSGDPFPAFVNASMGVSDDTGASFESAPEAAKELASISDDFELIDEGELEVAGAENAYRLHVKRADSYQGASVRVEQVQVFLEMPSGVLSTVRFQAPEGQLDESGLDEVLDTLTVAEEG